MNTLLAAFVSLVLISESLAADRKYGFAADSDEALLTRVRDPQVEAVILGCVFRYQHPKDSGKPYISDVTVFEAYKGKFKVGQKVSIAIYAEEGPPEEEEMGILRFYLLTKRDSANTKLANGG